jgi:hypothetical protein
LGNFGGFAASRLRDTRGSLLVRWRPPDVVCERLEILHDGCKVELVAGAAETPKTHALEVMVTLCEWAWVITGGALMDPDVKVLSI